MVADPFQRYRGLEIAADSPRPEARAEVRYHLVGDLSLDRASSAGAYAREAHRAIDDVLARGRVPIVAGGTGLYLRAAVADLGFPDPPAPEVRARAEALAARDPTAALAALRARDAAAAARVDPRNARRIARAIEVAEAGGAPRAGALWTGETRRRTLLVGVVRPIGVVDALVAARVRRELEEGLVAEIEAALDGPALSREAAQIIGVREVRAVRAGTLAPEAVEAALAARTRRLARKQLTWLRKTPAVPLDLGDAPAEQALPALLRLWRRPSGD